jgi:NAD(P)-dependent dehydrogenase (short-subunit alcohol dehydrogenase family)|tara:strand:- start:348 stop:1121 length:774 start_codon:yes stop_codon:yes gene_type:complete
MNYFKKLFNLNNKKIFIIGGSGLIGSQVCEGLLELNGFVLNLDIKNNLKIKDNNYSFKYFNLNKISSLEKNIDKIIDKFGLPDVVINSAYPKTSDWSRNNFKNIKLKSFEKNLKIQLNSGCWTLKKFADKMKKNNIKGSIIQLSSIYGLVGQDLSIYHRTQIRENMTYSIIKGGFSNFVRQMASYYGKYGIKVNAVCAGGVKDQQQKVFIKNYSKKTPLGRLAEPKEIASAIIFLSLDASSYISGSNLVVDGGWTSI